MQNSMPSETNRKRKQTFFPRGLFPPLGIIIAVSLLILLSWQSWRERSGEIQSPTSRKQFTSFAVPLLKGGSWDLSEHRGEVVLVNFWASWCPPCRAETPGLVELARKYQPKGLAVVGIPMDEGDTGAVESFVREYKMPYAIAKPSPSIPVASRIASLPTSFLLDRKGRVARTYLGAVREAVLQADVERVLGEEDDTQQKPGS